MSSLTAPCQRECGQYLDVSARGQSQSRGDGLFRGYCVAELRFT